MQPWISLANVIGDLLVLAAAVTDLAAARARARTNRPRRPRNSPTTKAITARYHAHHDTGGVPRGQVGAHLRPRHHP
jgi:hypothetical protein